MLFFFRCWLVVLYSSAPVWADDARQVADDSTATVDRTAPAQSVQTVAQQTRQQAALQAALEQVQTDQARLTLMALEARAALDSTVASRL